MSKKEEMLKLAYSHYGVKELTQGKLNPIVDYFLDNISGRNSDKNLSWCAAYVNSVLKDSGFKYLSTFSARACLKVGKSVTNPEIGDIVIFWRESKQSWKGHVGFYMGTNGSLINVLGGNQSNSVCIRQYPVHRLLGYVRPVISKK